MWTQLARFVALFPFILPLLVAAQSGNIVVEFSQDTAYACVNAPYELTVSVSGGSGVYEYSWSTGDTSSAVTIMPQVGDSLFYVLITDSTGDFAADSIWVIGLPECVWPGDANGDGTANNLDLLLIGRAYGTQGLTRPNPHFNWIGQAAPSWAHSFSSGVNYAHVDAAGDGEIDAYDIQGIRQNYVLPQQSSGGSVSSVSGVSLYIDVPSSNFSPGDTIVSSIMLGTTAFPADSIYGIAFSIVYDHTLVDSGSARLEFSDSWLGDVEVDMEALGQDFADADQIDGGITRIDHVERTGSGKIADIIITVDDIAGKNSGIEMLNIKIQRVWLIREDGSTIDVNASVAQVAVITSTENPLSNLADQVRVFPNPASEHIMIEINQEDLATETVIELLSPSGQILERREVKGRKEIEYNVGHLSRGFYLLRIVSPRGYVNKKLIIK